jgi:hypothetical protein
MNARDQAHFDGITFTPLASTGALTTCGECKAVVEAERVEGHREWHAAQHERLLSSTDPRLWRR